MIRCCVNALIQRGQIFTHRDKLALHAVLLLMRELLECFARNKGFQLAGALCQLFLLHVHALDVAWFWASAINTAHLVHVEGT